MSSPPSSALPPPGRLLAAAGLPRRVYEALDLTLELVGERLLPALSRTLPVLADRVIDVGDFGVHHRVTMDMIDAPKRLLRDGPLMTRVFVGYLERDLAALRDPPATPDGPAVTAKAPMPTFGELRLVDEDDDDIATIVGSIALRHESRTALPLQLLCQRFGVLAASPAFEPGTLPVGPRRLAEMLAEASAGAGFGLQLTAAVLREFDRQVLLGYDDFAETLNNLLSRLGIMPGLSYVPLRTRARPVGDAQPDEPSPYDVPPADGEITQQRIPILRPATASADEVDPELFDLLQQLLSARRGLADRFRRNDPIARARPPLPSADALKLLARPEAQKSSGDFETIRQWLLLQARQQNGEAVALAPADADTFELLSLLYTHLSDDLRPDTPASRMLDQLRLPLVRVALKDHDFFVRASHPARQLLNLVAETGATWQSPEDVDPQFLLHVQQVVDAVARAPDKVDTAFESAVQVLDAQQQALARRAEIAERRSIEAARGKERLAVARRRAASVIENAMTDLKLPIFHRNMLRQAWADVLTLAHLRHGEEAEEWLSLVGETRDLALAGARMAVAPEGLAAQVEQWLVTVGHHIDDAARISRILTASLEDERDDAATRTELAMRLKARARLGEDSATETPLPAPRSPAEEAAYRRLRKLPFGTWLIFRGEDGGTSRRRLAWWSPTTDSALFVNPRGQRLAESTLDTVARDIAAGRASIVADEEGGLVDRAWRSVLQSLRSLGGKANREVAG